MFCRVSGFALVASLMAVSANAGILNETDYGEFGDSYGTPTDFSGYSSVVGTSSGQTDFEYFWFESFLPGTRSLDFALENSGSGSNMLIRLSATPFTMSEWDWKIDELDAGNMQARELYANQWSPQDSYSFRVPDGFDGPLFGFARFYGTNSTSSFSINAVGAQTPQTSQTDSAVTSAPVTSTLSLMLAALGALIVVAAIRRRKSG